MLLSESRLGVAPAPFRSRPQNGIVGHSPVMLKLLEEIGNAARADANVLILGETGVGKELVARTIHARSARHAGPFLPINCAAIPEGLLDAELFGYERGAYTGAHASKEGLLEAADAGTLFLDELCELEPCLQAKLLRAVEEGEARRLGGRRPVPFDVRFVAATNRDIHEQMAAGRFRGDLFFRLDVIEIRIPPLRERRQDIPQLARQFLSTCAARRPQGIEGIAPEAMALLTKYDWPGNVRELENAIERAVAYAKEPLITAEDLPGTIAGGSASRASSQEGCSFRVWRQKALGRLEREFITNVLTEHHGNVSRAAKALEIHRSTFQRLMRKYNLGVADIRHCGASVRHHPSL